MKLNLGYVYVMRRGEYYTKSRLKHIKAKITEIKIYRKCRESYDGRLIYGRIRFDEKLDLYDAMNACLIPAFKEEVADGQRG